MKSIIVSSVVTALLVLSGCSDKDPVIEESKDAPVEQKVKDAENAQEVSAVETETVDSSDASVLNENSTNSATNSMENIEKGFASVYFAFDQFQIDTNNQAKIEKGSSLAKGGASKFTVKLEGNCDEWGSDEYNFALGLKRANAVKKALVAEGIAKSRITMVSYGESNPTCNEKTKDCWAKNRRVDFKLLP